MPTTKKTSSPVKEIPPVARGCDCTVTGHSFGAKLIMTLVGVLLVYVIFYLGVSVRNSLKEYDYIGSADRSEKFITVSGVGKAIGDNDIAMTTIGYSNTEKEVTLAQAKNKEVMDKVMADLLKIGIAESDLKSNYTIFPEYRYSEEEGSVVSGYRVTNTVTVKIRDLTLVESVLALAGMYGVNEVSGLQFTVDDETTIKDLARTEALKNAAAQLKYLSEALGVKMGKVVSYNEYFSGDDSYLKYSSSVFGLGGGEGVPPQAAGSEEMVANVNITYELL